MYVSIRSSNWTRGGGGNALWACGQRLNDWKIENLLIFSPAILASDSSAPKCSAPCLCVASNPYIFPQLFWSLAAAMINKNRHTRHLHWSVFRCCYPLIPHARWQWLAGFSIANRTEVRQPRNREGIAAKDCSSKGRNGVISVKKQRIQRKSHVDMQSQTTMYILNSKYKSRV